jgi:hypothetical protein
MEDFIGTGYVSTETCDQMIQFFKDSPDKHPGKLGEIGEIRPKDKLSTDVSVFISDPKNFQYLDELGKVMDDYLEKYEYATRDQAHWYIEPMYNIQKYDPGEGYFLWHCENAGHIAQNKRHLSFITYLNTVEVDGGTEFKYLDKVVSPTKGNTIVFPGHWTHTHRGVVAPKETKYIATGWFSYTGEN